MPLSAGLSLSLLLLAVPALAEESKAEVSQDSTCSRSLIQTQTAQSAELAKTRSNTSNDVWDEDTAKAAAAPATKEVEKTEVNRAHLKTASAASTPKATEKTASAAIALKESVHKGDLKTSGKAKASKHIKKETKKAHAMAMRFVEFGMTFWEAVIIMLTIALFTMLCGYGEFEYKQDPKNFGMKEPAVRYENVRGKGYGKGKGSQQSVTKEVEEFFDGSPQYRTTPMPTYAGR
mmetsp:Transcript_49978/g.87986  ORF Transcript_49978/g.87986 Transcript_49978/m.87986 type:complete len:234 (-) Transcript_49978:131-832(-)